MMAMLPSSLNILPSVTASMQPSVSSSTTEPDTAKNQPSARLGGGGCGDRGGGSGGGGAPEGSLIGPLSASGGASPARERRRPGSASATRRGERVHHPRPTDARRSARSCRPE